MHTDDTSETSNSELSVYNSFSGTTLGIDLTRPSASAHATCRIGLLYGQEKFSGLKRVFNYCLILNEILKWLMLSTMSSEAASIE